MEQRWGSDSDNLAREISVWSWIVPRDRRYSPAPMNEEWDFYLKQVDGQVASITVNLGLRATAPLAGRGQLLRVRVHLRSPAPNGLSSQEEFETLNQLEDRWVEALKAETLFVGRSTCAGVRELFFYGGDLGGLEARITELTSSFSEHRVETSTSQDPGWKVYREFLSPNEEQMQSIENRRVCLSLQSHGDALTEPRPIDHFVYFDNEPARARFIERTKSLGFDHQLLPPDPNGPPKFGVQLVRVDVPTFEGIDAITLPLYREALAQGGEYDGWGSPIPGADQHRVPGKTDSTPLKVLVALFGLALAIVAFGWLTRK